jgi:prenyltransferase beta subunit
MPVQSEEQRHSNENDVTFPQQTKTKPANIMRRVTKKYENPKTKLHKQKNQLYKKPVIKRPQETKIGTSVSETPHYQKHEGTQSKILSREMNTTVKKPMTNPYRFTAAAIFLCHRQKVFGFSRLAAHLMMMNML